MVSQSFEEAIESDEDLPQDRKNLKDWDFSDYATQIWIDEAIKNDRFRGEPEHLDERPFHRLLE